jgi:hypothetical protein
MTAKEVLNAMAKGEVLCMGYDKNGMQYWLEPRRILVRSDVAQRVINLPNIVTGGDRLFSDASSQTWKMDEDGRNCWGKRKSKPNRTRKRGA